MAVICWKRLSTKDFHYSVDTKNFVAEISTLSQGRTRAVFDQVYDDACDEGFVLVSHKTGEEVTFVVDKIDQDSEGDIAGWHLIPINRKSGRRDISKDFTVLVIND